MVSLIFVLAGIFVAGIARSLLLCSLTCTSGIASYAVSKEYTYRDAFRMSLHFVLPRVFIFTCLGLLFGILTFEFFTAVKIFSVISSLSYFLMGAVLFILGVLVFTKRDIPECKSRKLIFGLGSLTGLGCVAEFVFTEGIILSGVISLLPDSSLFDSMLLSGAAMFLFALGLSLPAIIIITTAGKIANLIPSKEDIKIISGCFLIVLGLLVIAVSAAKVIL